MKLKEFIQEHKSDFHSEKISKKADVNFEQLLQQELHQPKKQKLVYLKFVAVAACLALVFCAALWYQNNDSFTKIEQDLMASLDDNSAGKRLEAVYTFNDDYKKEDRLKIYDTQAKFGDYGLSFDEIPAIFTSENTSVTCFTTILTVSNAIFIVSTIC